ncbi:MAG: methylated-DNA--[protein]-cysteine S-methyltransferase [Labilithrix sp.]|nr:methylated-DNA--[protein]-cysteine S-methyltransferase [Labilithrix sp.]MCW5816705.1 methylated-DNA--[protein]-cysteine S-methyltransferase [Labilithrix sp.]
MPWTTFDTAIGTCALAWSDAGVTWLQLPEATAELTVERLRKKAQESGEKTKPPKSVAKAIAAVQRHLAGEPQTFEDVPLDLGALPPFNATVYRALQTVPPGKTVTYGELAGLVGAPSAARAVGRAMATNPFPILVACHRVFASGGKPGGFSAYGGLVTKEKILALEGWSDPKSARLLFDAPALPFDAKAALAHLTSADPVLGAHIASIDFALTLEPSEGTFDALAKAIVYQQLNGRAAATIFGRVRALFPKNKLDPRRVLALDEAELRRAGLSASKLAALRDLATRAERGEIPTLAELAKMEDDAIVEVLTLVRGIGRWTVEMLLLFRLGRPDVFPIGDYGIKKGYARLFHPKKRRDELPDVAAMVRRAERWKPYRSVASWYLWRA